MADNILPWLLRVSECVGFNVQLMLIDSHLTMATTHRAQRL